MKCRSFEFIVLIFILIFYSCTDDNLCFDYNQIEYGKAARINISLKSDELSRSSGLSDSEESQVNNIQLFIFNSSNVLVTSKFFPTDSLNLLQNVSTISGNMMKIYAIANITPLSARYNNIYDNVFTVSDLDSLIAYTTGDDVEQDRILLMEGDTIADIKDKNEGCTNITIRLFYVMSKVTVNIYDNTPINESVSWSGWKIANMPSKSYIIPKSNDAVNANENNDFITQSSYMSFNDSIDTSTGANIKTTTFYIFENRRGGRKNGSPSDTLQKNKTKYAPNNATAIIFKGVYYYPDSVKNIISTIYLGENAYDDYNVYRSKKYIYDIYVSSIDSILVDSRYDELELNYQLDILETTLDCHYDWRPIKISAFGEKLKIDIVDMNNNPITDSNFWLKISKINLNEFVLKNGIYVRQSYPLDTMKLSIDVPTLGTSTSEASTFYYLYADEFLSEGSRSAKIRVVINDGKGIILKTITQKGYLSLGNNVGLRYYNTSNNYVENVDSKLIVENKEEATLTLTPDVSQGVENTLTMQYGFFEILMQSLQTQDFYQRNGYDNTKELVVNSNGNLRPPYGRINNAIISEKNHNPIFNTYAARYCFEKNRDTDGNGIIEGDEIKWYLPSFDEQKMIYIGNPVVGLSGNVYTSSTEYSNLGLTGMRFSIGRSGTADKYIPFYVRCVRRINPTTSLSSPYVQSGTTIINCEGFNANLLRTSDIVVPVPTHNESSQVNAKFSKKFQVAKVDAGIVNWQSTGGICSSYNEIGDNNATDKWRVPTQRELYILYLMQKELTLQNISGYSNFNENGVYYWSATEYSGSSSEAFGMDIKNGIMYNRPKSFFYYVRCIKDVP